ncbi:hypothetical protein LQW54_005517 [Pestalotiopsis sp. IQ-011]
MLSSDISPLSFQARVSSTPTHDDLFAPEAPGLLTVPNNLFGDLKVLQQIGKIEFNQHVGAHVVIRYDDIAQILDDPETFSSQPTIPSPPDVILARLENKCPMRGTLLGLDNPDHDRLRRRVASFFVPRRLKRFQAMIEKLANELIDGCIDKGQIDIKSSFALPLPLKVISVVAGLDPERWQWVGQSLALFGGHADMNVGSLEDKIEGIIALHEYVADLIQQRKTDRRDDLISHIWNERDSGSVVMTDFEHLSMIPGLLLAGHETTTNVLSMGLSHFLHNGLWSAATRDDQMAEETIEELVRYDSAMRRLVTRPVKIGNTRFQPGDTLFVAYNAGSRDPRHFDHADSLSLGQIGRSQHLGFGRGIHACLGAPLARLLLRVEMRTLAWRLPGLRLVTPYSERVYHTVSEGRGIDGLVLGWDSGVAVKLDVREAPVIDTPGQSLRDEVISVMIEDVLPAALDIIEVTFIPVPGSTLPEWAPGVPT